MAAEHGEIVASVLVDSGLRYCTIHHGIVDCDESDCDFRHDELTNRCPDCEGHGYMVGPEGGTYKCGPCDGDGVTRCESTALLYQAGVGS